MAETLQDIKPSENLRRLHQNLSSRGGFNVPYDRFAEDMKDEAKLKKLYSNLSKTEGFNVPYDKFRSDMFVEETAPKNITIPESSRIAYKHNNPGNLMYVGQPGAKRGEPKAGGGHWAEFDTPQAGFEGIIEDIKAKQTGKSRTGLGPDSTVEEYISTYAPPNENDTQRYIDNFTKFLNVSKDTKLSEIDPVEAAKFIAKIESSTEIRPIETKQEKVLSEPKKETGMTYTPEEIENLEALDRQPTSLAYADAETRNKYVEYKKWKEATKYTVTPEDRQQARHTLDYIGTMEEETGQQLEEVEKELNNKYGKVPSWESYQFSMPGTVQQQPWTYEAEMSDPLAEERKNLFQKKRLIEETKRYYRSVANGNKTSAIDRFSEGIKTFDVSNFVFLGINDMIGDIEIAQIYSKAEKQGIESLSQFEKDVVVLDNIKKQAQETAMKDRAFAVGSGIAETAPFIADMVVTSGIGAGIRRGVIKGAANTIRSEAARKVVANLSDATVRSLMFPSTYGMAAERTQADVAFDEEGEPMIVEGTGEPIGEAMLKAVGSNAVEIIAEQWIGKGLQNVTTRLTKKGIPILKNTKVGEVLRAVDDAAKNSPIKKMAAIQDPITEFGEEIFAGIMQPIVTGDGSPLDFFERENMIRTALTVSIISYGTSTPSSIKGIHNLYKKNQGEKVYRELDENSRLLFDAAAEAETVDAMQENIRSIQDNMLTSESTIPEIKEANRKTMRLINYLSAVKKATHEAGKIEGPSYQLGDRVYTDKARFFELLEKSLEKDNPVPFVKINNDAQAQQDLDNIFGTVERKSPETANIEAESTEKVPETKTEKAETETVDEIETPESSQKVEPETEAGGQKLPEGVKEVEEAEGDFVTFVYENKNDIPLELRDRISSEGEINGKQTIRVTIPREQASELLKTAQESETTKTKEDGKEMQEQQVSEQAVQKSEDKTTERSEETAEETSQTSEETGKKRTTVTGRRIRTAGKFLNDIKDAVTRKLAKRKADEIVKKKQAELDKDMKEFLPKEIEKIEREGLVVEHAARGEKEAKRYHVKRKPDGTYSVVSMFDRDASDRPKRVTNKRLRDAILSKYRKQRKADIAEIERTIEEKYLQETDAEINAVVSEYQKQRAQAEPTETTEFSGKEGKPTKPAEGKKRREKKPSEGTKVVVDEAAALKDEIRIWTSQAREQKAFTEAEFRGITEKIREKLKEAVDNKHINRGQYKAIINRLGNASTPKRRQKLLDYVDNVLDGSEYKGLVAEANKHIEKVKKANKKDKSKFGDAAALATEFTSIDPKQLTPEELRQFNTLAEKIMKNRKAPSISYMEAAVSKFSDNYREDYDAFAAKIDKAKEDGTLDDLAAKLKKELNDDIAESEELFKKKNLKTAQDYIKAERKLRAARKKANRLLDEGLIDSAEREVLIEKLGDKEGISGEWENKLAQFKSDYAEVLAERKKDPAVRDGLTEITEQEREAYGQLLSAKKEQLAKLKMVDLEAFSNVIDNLEDGYVIPEAFQLRRALDSLAKRDSFLDAAVKNWLSSSAWKAMVAKNLRSLSDIISSTKSHRLDLRFGNTSKFNTINAIYSSVARAIQKESNFNKKFEERRIKILNDFLNGYLTSAERLLMKASPSGRLGKKATPEKIAQIRDKANNKIREVQNFLIERSWQQEDSFKNGDVNEKNASILSARYNEKNPLDKGIPDREMENFFEERERWLTQFNEAKKNGLTKKVNGVEVIDVDKYEQWLRKDKNVAKLLDEHDKYYEEVKPYVKVATMENGRTFLEKQKYTPFRGKVTGGKVDVNDIKTEIEGGIINPKMQANSTYNRKGAIQWLENDMFKIMENHTREAMRNYFVYPESRASLEALKQALNEYSKENPDNFEETLSLRNALMNDLKDRAARYYNSGKYKIEYDPVFDRWLKGAKKGMLVNPARVPAEMIANIVRATVALGGMPTKALTMDRKNKVVFDALMKEYMSDKYWSRYSPEIGGISTKRTFVAKLEEGADWIITVSDKAVGRPLMRHEFTKAFKEMTGKEFDVDKYISDGQYAIDNKVDIHKAATWAVRRLEELFNDKSVLTTPQLTKFVAGTIKANPNKSITKLFDLFQSFNRNEVDQLTDAGRRIASGDTELVKMGTRDMFAVMTSNVLYQVLRRGAGVTVSMAIASLLRQDLTDYEEEEKEMLLSMERLLKDVRRAELGLFMGGSANIYGYAARVGMFVLEKTDILKEDQKEYVYQIMVDDLYGRKIPEWGSPQSALTATLPVPSTAINDAFKGADGMGALLSSLYKAVEAKKITEKEMWEVVSLVNLGFKYFAPNPVTPTAQKTIDRQIREARDDEKKKSGSSGAVRPGSSTPARPDRNTRPDRSSNAPSRPNR